MLLRLSLDGVDYVADVGFGGSTLTGPLRLELDTEQVTPHEPFRLSRAGCDLVMEIRLRDGWQALYRFDLQAQLVSDYEITSWYLCHHPDSHFRAGLIAARSAPGRRYTLRDTELAVHHLNGPTERRVLTTAAELRATLEDTFRLRVPQRPEVRAAFERLTSGTPEAATA